MQGWGEVLAVEIGSAGGARAAGVRAYLARHDRALESTWLASTDADTVVPETWIDHQLGLARLGVAGVAGIVAVDSFADHPSPRPRPVGRRCTTARSTTRIRTSTAPTWACGPTPTSRSVAGRRSSRARIGSCGPRCRARATRSPRLGRSS